MKNLKTKIYKIVGVSLFLLIFAASPEYLRGQNKRLYGELTVIKNSAASGAAAGDAFVTIDGVRAVSGRSVSSPSDIETPPESGAKISFAQTGAISLAPNSKINLSFVNSSIAGDLTKGEAIIETAPDTAINIFTRDGSITTPNRSEKNVVKIWFLNGATQISVSSGQVLFNKVLISAGELYPQKLNNAAAADDDDDNKDSSKSGIRPIFIIAILGAVAAAAIVALSVSSSNNDAAAAGGSSTVSPTR